MVPSLLAVIALLLEASPDALQKDLPEWLERTSTVLPSEAAFLTEAGRMVDPFCYSLLSREPGLAAGPMLGCEDVRSPAIEHGAFGCEGYSK